MWGVCVGVKLTFSKISSTFPACTASGLMTSTVNCFLVGSVCVCVGEHKIVNIIHLALFPCLRHSF